MKKIILALLVIAFGFNGYGQSVPCYVPTSGLVAWYPFSGNTVDSSGNGHNLINNAGAFCNDRFSSVNSAGDLVGINNWFGGSTGHPTSQPALSTGANSSVSI